MELRVRKIQEKDLDLFDTWYKKYDDTMPERDFLPEDGLGGFVVCKGDDPIGAMWLYLTNAKTCIPTFMISDKDYKDVDKKEALQLLMDFTTDFGEQLGCKYAFAWARGNRVLDYHLESGYVKSPDQYHEVIYKYKWEE